MADIQSDYFDELEAQAKNIFDSTSSADMGEVCSSFNRKLKMLPPQLCLNVSSWLYALIRMYNLKYHEVDSIFPYSPKVSETGEGVFFISWNMAKLPSRILQGIVIGYMSACLNAL